MQLPSPVDLYKTIEQHLNPRLHEVMNTDEFAQALSAVHTGRAVIGRAIGGANVWLLHAVNMPAKSDITRLSRHMGELDREVRMLRHELDQREGGHGHHAP